MDQSLTLAPKTSEHPPTFDRSGFAITPGPPEGGSSSFGWGLFSGSEEEPGAFEVVPTPAPPMIVWRPCRIYVDVEMAESRYRLGEFICGFVPPPPLGEEERRAIASRPGAMKAIVYHLGCKNCGDEIELYVQLNPHDPPQNIKPTAVPLETALSPWNCKCGQSAVDLTFLKLGLHDLFRRANPRMTGESVIHYTSLYESGRVEALLAEFEKLIESATEEEPVQKFLEENPVFWAFLSPVKILHKPAVLTKKKADFGILTAHKILYLVEIEKPTTRLVNKDDSISGEILRGANQIRDWEVVVDDHRLALLSELNLKESEVQEVRYLLIGGMARRTKSDGLIKLRRSPLASKTQFYCFDELGSFLHIVAGELRYL
jgi:hypothetical protein